MRIEGEYTFSGPRELVWEMLNDPQVLASALPGTQQLTQVAENEYEGEMNVRVGPVSGTFTGRLVVSDATPPERCTLTVDGRGAPGFLKGSGLVNLIAQEDGTTLMKYEGEVQVGGKLAGVGQRMLDSVSKSMLRQGLDTMNEALKARVAAQETGQAVAYTPPTEAEFAQGVAKDMAGKLTSIAEVRMILYVVPVALVLLLISAILSRCGGG